MGRIKRILCAVDFSEATARTAAYARELAEGLGAEIVALFVAQSLNRYVLFKVDKDAVDNFVNTVMGGAREKMDKLLAEHFQGITAEGIVDMGYPPETIIAAAKARGCDMIVIGTHGRAGWDRIVFGSVAEKVVKGAGLPVMTVPPRGEE